MRRRPALTFTLVLMAAAALHALSVARQSSTGAGQRLNGDEDYVCTACGPIPKGGVCELPSSTPRSTVDQP